MDWINYHHLLYFWVTAREGSITRASERLRLAQPTVSGQIQSLEKDIGEPLFLRQGRRLILTDTGKLVLRYADQIFTVGQELVDTLRNRPTDGRQRLSIGIADAVPRLIAQRLIAPLIGSDVHVVCEQGPVERLVASLAEFDLDLVLADTPYHRTEAPVASHRLLGDSPVAIYGTAELVGRLGASFPRSLDGAPLLLPSARTALRRALDGWFQSAGVAPRIVAEFDDSALMKAFGQSGAGLFPAPTCVHDELVRQTGTTPLAELAGVRAPLYAVTVERRLQNPLVARIIDVAQTQFASLLEASA